MWQKSPSLIWSDCLPLCHRCSTFHWCPLQCSDDMAEAAKKKGQCLISRAKSSQNTPWRSGGLFSHLKHILNHRIKDKQMLTIPPTSKDGVGSCSCCDNGGKVQAAVGHNDLHMKQNQQLHGHKPPRSRYILYVCILSSLSIISWYTHLYIYIYI